MGGFRHSTHPGRTESGESAVGDGVSAGEDGWASAAGDTVSAAAPLRLRAALSFCTGTSASQKDNRLHQPAVPLHTRIMVSSYPIR